MLAAVGLISLVGWTRAGAAFALVVGTCLGLVLWYHTTFDGNWRGEDWRSAVAYVDSRKPGAVVPVPWWTHSAVDYYGVRAGQYSAADSVWVLSWSEHGHDLPASTRAPLGLGGHRLVESRQFGWRLSAQLWRRP
jgi:hypothetical protein